jgi:hypothetical protein
MLSDIGDPFSRPRPGSSKLTRTERRSRSTVPSWRKHLISPHLGYARRAAETTRLTSRVLGRFLPHVWHAWWGKEAESAGLPPQMPAMGGKGHRAGRQCRFPHSGALRRSHGPDCPSSLAKSKRRGGRQVAVTRRACSIRALATSSCSGVRVRFTRAPANLIASLDCFALAGSNRAVPSPHPS